MSRGSKAAGAVGMRLTVLALICTTAALAQTQSFASQPSSAASFATADAFEGAQPFAVDRWVIAGGSITSTGGIFHITGTLGQPDADPLQPATGGSFGIAGGFWAGVASAAPGDSVFRDGFEAGAL